MHCVRVKLLLLGAVSSGMLSAAVLVNGTAGRVAGRALTVQDARFAQAIQDFRDRKPQVTPETETPAQLKSAVQRLLVEEMVFAEMKSLRVDGGSKQDFDKGFAQRKDPKRAAEWDRLLRRFGKTDAAAMQQAWKSYQVESFIQRRLDTLTPIVTQTEVERHIKAKHPNATDAELQKLRPSALMELRAQRMRSQLEEWIGLLRKKYNVVNDFEGGAS